MGKTLVIIESSGSKMKKLSKILGDKYIVKASMGHINGLKSNGDGVSYDPSGKYKLNYEISMKGIKGKNTPALKKLVKGGGIDDVIIATDRDREGEAIGYHICKYLGLDLKNTKRLIFNAVDKKTILGAMENPVIIDMNIVNEQMGRASIDYLIGFGISPVVSRKLKKRGLSAGRVQSVVLKMIMDKEKEALEFESKRYFSVKGKFIGEGDVVLDADLKERFEEMVVEIDDEEQVISGSEAVNEFLEECAKSKFTLGKLKSVKKNTKPPAPYITSSYLQDAGKRFGMSSKGAMMVAQKLYEEGKITYMRTDCSFIVPEFQNLIGEYIVERWGDKYVELRQYQSSDKNAQEAHEAIRITDIGVQELGESFEPIDKKIYKMIWQRTIASQMAKKESRVVSVPVLISKRDEKFEAKAEEVLFDGYMAVYVEKADDKKAEKVAMLKGLVEGVEVICENIIASEKRSKPPPRYNDVMITKRMEQMGIGRPSTYASMIPKLLERTYILEDSREVLPEADMLRYILDGSGKISEEIEKCSAEIDKKKFFPTELGLNVGYFLEEEFNDLFNYEYTAEMESELDKIAEGKVEWMKFVHRSHMVFKNKVDEMMGSLPNVSFDDGKRLLGEIDGEKVYAFCAKYGPVVLIGKKFIPLKSKKLVNTITLEQVEAMPKFPIKLGDFEDKSVEMRDGKYGLYIYWDGKNFNIDKELGVSDVNFELACKMIEEKRKKELKVFNSKLKILNGPYGPYIYSAGVFASIPEGVEIEELTEKMCKDIVAKSKREKSSGEGGRGGREKKFQKGKRSGSNFSFK